MAKRSSSKPKTALVLSGGGARAAYQVGVLKAISELSQAKECPFDIVSGISAGAVNGMWLASREEDFPAVVQSMWDAWAEVKSETIFLTNPVSLFRIGLRWIFDRTFGIVNRKHQITYLLDTSPLKKFLSEKINFEALNRRVAEGHLYGVSVTAANYQTGHSTTFFAGSDDIPTWRKQNRIGIRESITENHVLASAAIPIFFPPVKIQDDFYGDGMVRSNAPLSSAIHLGADKLFIIGISGPRAPISANRADKDFISLGEIAGTVLNGLFLDALDADYERMQRINRTLTLMSPEQLAREPDGLRVVPSFFIRPSRSACDDLDVCDLNQVPATLRMLFKGIGMNEQKGTEMLSYLLFERRHVLALLQQGYADGMAQRDQILAFLA